MIAILLLIALVAAGMAKGLPFRELIQPCLYCFTAALLAYIILPVEIAFLVDVVVSIAAVGWTFGLVIR